MEDVMGHGNLKRDIRPVTDHRLTIGKRTVYFTFGYRFGPLITDGYGQPAKRQPASEKSAFWPPFEAWLAEYKKTNPPPPIPVETYESDQWDRRS